jgi:hypothetical protein
MTFTLASANIKLNTHGIAKKHWAAALSDRHLCHAGLFVCITYVVIPNKAISKSPTGKRITSLTGFYLRGEKREWSPANNPDQGGCKFRWW